MGLQFGGGTRILQALEKSVDLFAEEKRTERRRAVLIVTDNEGVRDRREAPLVKKYWEADAVLSALLVKDIAQTIRGFTPGGLMMRSMSAGVNTVVDKSGGDVLNVDSSVDFEDAMQRLRARYTLYYALPPGKPGVERKIAVQLDAAALKRYPKARVRARSGYVGPGN